MNAARLFLAAIDEGAETKTDEMVKRADRAIQSADGLLKGLLDISRLDHGSVDPKPASLMLGPLLEDLADEAAPMAERAGLKLRVAPTSASVLADPDFLQSILRNFLSNARRYTRSGGVLIGARRRGDVIRIEVWDTGIGVPEDKHPYIFEEFHRLEDADKFGVRGAGLGLAIAKRMAGLMNAQIGLRSKAGKGSVFYVDVRGAVSAVKPHPSPSLAKHEAKTLLGLKILCLDDEPTILDGMEALLRSWGCEPMRAQTSEEAIKIAAI